MTSNKIYQGIRPGHDLKSKDIHIVPPCPTASSFRRVAFVVDRCRSSDRLQVTSAKNVSKVDAKGDGVIHSDRSQRWCKEAGLTSREVGGRAQMFWLESFWALAGRERCRWVCISNIN